MAQQGGCVLLGFLAVAACYVVTEHTADLLGVLPFLLFLACPQDDAPACGLWLMVILNSLVFVIFAFSFSKPQSARD